MSESDDLRELLRGQSRMDATLTGIKENQQDHSTKIDAVDARVTQVALDVRELQTKVEVFPQLQQEVQDVGSEVQDLKVKAAGASKAGARSGAIVTAVCGGVALVIAAIFKGIALLGGG